MREKAILGIVFAMLIVIAMFATLPTKAQFDGQIKIGIIGPIGYPHWSPAGMKEASEMAAEEINAAGGVNLTAGDYEIVLAFGDEHAATLDETAAALEVERLITVEGCEFLIGGFRSEVTGAMIEMAMDYDVPFFINGASTDGFISDNVPVDYERYKYLFRVNPVNSTILFMTIAGAVQYLLPTVLLPLYGHMLWPEAPNPQVRVAVITEDLLWTETMHTMLSNPAYYPSVLGPYANVTYAGRIPDGTTDCSSWLSDVIASEARLLIHVFSGLTGVPFIMQWKAMNVEALPLGINVMSQLEGQWTTTGGACEYETFLNFVGTRTPIIPGVTEVFWDNFVARTGVWPIYTAFGGYNALYVLAEAFESIGSTDKDALVAHFEDPSYESTVGVNGKSKFTTYHDVYSNEYGPFWTEGYTRAFFAQWNDGRMTVISPVDQLYSKRTILPMYFKADFPPFDGKVNWEDLLDVAMAYGSALGDPGYVVDVDINGDDKIDWKDLLILALEYGGQKELPLP